MSVTKVILNGIVGDYLDASGNELAIPMALYDRHNKPTVLSELKIKFEQQQSGNSNTRRHTLCILIHGLVNDESSWSFPDGSGDYGSFLRQDMDNLTPLYLRYNTGLHVSTNGRKLSLLLENLMTTMMMRSEATDENGTTTTTTNTTTNTNTTATTTKTKTTTTTPRTEIVLLCHSMGGLVARSATHHAVTHQLSWVRQQSLSKVIFLGTPHQGSYWERAGNVVSSALNAVPRPYMKLAAQVANLRSAGIKDLRYGYILDEDWAEEDSDAFLTNTKKGTELLLFDAGVTYHVITGTITNDPKHPVSQVFGDALVSKSSAQGRSDTEEHNLDFAPPNTETTTKTDDESSLSSSSPLVREFPGVHHTALQTNRDVYEQIKEWISTTHDDDDHHHHKPSSSSSSSSSREGSTTLVAPDRSDDIPGEETKNESIEKGNDDEFHSWPDENIRNVDNDNDFHAAPAIVGKWAHCRGAANLMQDAVDAGATAVEGVQNELTDEVYWLLHKITPISPAVACVEVIHKGIVSGIYGAIRGVNYGTGETLKYVFSGMDSLESIDEPNRTLQV